MTTCTDFDIRQTTLEEQQLYNHLLNCVQVELPTQLIERFQRLLIDGAKYVDPKVWLALEKLATSKRAEQDFKFVLNRCCHILINHWQMQPQLQGAIPELVALFEKLPEPTRIPSRSTRRLRHLVQLFTETEQYRTLQRLSQVMSGTAQASSNESREVGTLIGRYPYLYEHYLLSEDSSDEHQQTVRQIQGRVQRRFELDLSQYVTYQVRRAHAVRRQSKEALDKIIQPVNNPTLLSERELAAALKQFVGKVQGADTYRDVAQSFLTHSSHTSSYKDFKDDLYEYLTASIDPAYGKHQFNDQLHNHFKNTLPTCDSHKPASSC